MIDDPVRHRVLKLVEPSLIGVELLADVCVKLVGSGGNHYIVLRPAYAE